MKIDSDPILIRYARWPDGAADGGTAVYTITHEGGVASQSVSQRGNGGAWVWLGTYEMDPANNPEVTLTAANDGAVYADAVRFVSGDAIGGDIVYSHSDQLTSIQKLTDASGSLVWDRLARPFGETVSINVTSGIEQKLRFPGQYSDETGLNYNYSRDYDPTLGRYVESDPIGLGGGLNTYLYVASNPVKNIDFYGLETCGSGANEPWVPDNPLFFAFSPCCEAHDRCYDDCKGPTQAQCDEAFRDCMLRACRRQIGLYKTCIATALSYYAAVSAAGEEAFAAAREDCSDCEAER